MKEGNATDQERAAKECPVLSDGVLPAGWQRVEQTGGCALARDDKEAHGGSRSLRFENKLPTRANGITITQWIKAEPDTRYRIRVWVKGRDVVPTGAGGGPMVFVDSAGMERVYKSPPKPHGTFDWDEISFVVDTAPAAKDLAITLYLQWAAGAVWFDDVQVTQKEKVVHVESY